jgi:hypothetical protein
VTISTSWLIWLAKVAKRPPTAERVVVATHEEVIVFETDGPVRGEEILKSHADRAAPTGRVYGCNSGPVDIGDQTKLIAYYRCAAFQSSHKGPRVRQMIEAAGASLRYPPPYSPDFNPIENAFAKLKALLRKAAERSVDGLWSAIGRIIDCFTQTECKNYFTAAGYVQHDRRML